MSKIDFIFLHGFLGLPTDWNDVIENLRVELEGFSITGEYHVPDYFNRPHLGPNNSFAEVAEEFVNWIATQTQNKRKIIVGYSLGGRLAVHIFEKYPDLFEGLICVSTHPGLNSNQSNELNERLNKDHSWAEMFLTHDWRQVLLKWNDQSVFEGSMFEPERHEINYRRELLTQALVNWSLAKQEDKRFLIKKYSKKISWIIGAQDKKFVELTHSLIKEIAGMKVEVVPNAGHRVLFDNSVVLARCISKRAIDC